MPFNPDGTWKQEDDGVASRVAAITSGNSDMMKQARTAGLNTANRRGLGNSSMAVGAAQGAVLDRAIPIASQEAQQVYGKNTAQMGIDADARRTTAQLAAAERERIATSLTQLNSDYLNAQAATMQNEKVPAATRAAFQQSITDRNNATMALIQKLYGVQIDPATAQAAVGNGLGASPVVAAPVADPGYFARMYGTA